MNDEPIHGDLQVMNLRLEAIHRDVAELVRIVKGGSEPEHSLPARVQTVERQVEDIKASRAKAGGLVWIALGSGASSLALWIMSKLTGRHP